MNGLRIAAWGAGATVIAGGTAVALIAALLPHAHAPEAVGGATYASIARVGDTRLVVTSLRTGGAEAKGGLHVGDAIVAIDGFADPSLGTLRREMAGSHPVALTVERAGDAIPLTLLHARREVPCDEDPAGRGR